ncbi:hypothetical protein [Microbacterium sp. p3-SID336]|uniref:hypothetical protein n=1 Tax=Microbacterium sp. p3-SID336 TaxID=2916212 RepID=UPI0021A2CA9A|nr:hypothetical protein [Microbacterium sp. p3-SID336]MCT1479399.1 hypothetical protein [Microbacterium sp. p3-SID336]
MSTIKMFGASVGSRLSTGSGAYVDSCMVRPGTLPDLRGGNGNVRAGGSAALMIPSDPDCRLI